MFDSTQWKSSMLAKTKDGKLVEQLVADKDYLKLVTNCLKGTFPQIKVLRLVDSYKKPAAGFIYKEMNRATKIQTNYSGIIKRYISLPLFYVIFIGLVS
uniref:Uncharacterized protein n=1 Tax=Cajanus cajan TaxID=3821 RepID=A0A151SHL9_CAJCA|nr:hypothetical protein KK1_000461 [Cajanus cajan]